MGAEGVYLLIDGKRYAIHSSRDVMICGSHAAGDNVIDEYIVRNYKALGESEEIPKLRNLKSVIFGLDYTVNGEPIQLEQEIEIIEFTGETKKPKVNRGEFADINRAITQARNRVADTSIRKVKVDTLGAAIRDIDGKHFIEITEDSARTYAGQDFKREPGMRIFLVRGLFSNFIGDFAVYQKEGKLAVVYSCSAKKEIHADQCPFIVQLKSPPKQVLVNVEIR